MVQDFTSLGERELDVMAVLWALGSGTVAEVRAQLETQGVTLAYTTVLTILRNLETKQYVSREEEGRAHRYFARVAQQAAQRSALSRLVTSLFGGSPEALVARLVEQEQLSAEELSRLARSLTAASDRAPRREPDDRRGRSPYREEGDA
jgi:BlaI family transcriptional regulator, penicillinase repressor